MNDAEQLWRSKSDDELLDAAETLFEYTEEGERLIRAELLVRGLPAPPDRVAVCPKCGRSIGPNLPGDVCFECGEVLPPEIMARLGPVEPVPDADSAQTAGSHSGSESKWEYRTVKLQAPGGSAGTEDLAELDRALNALGDEGWELASALDRSKSQSSSAEILAVFKRPR